MKDETNKIISWIEMGYTRLNYKEELLLVNYIKQLQQENEKYKEVIEKAIEYEEEIMYLANKVAVTTQNVEIKAIRDRLEEIFEILKEEE